MVGNLWHHHQFYESKEQHCCIQPEIKSIQCVEDEMNIGHVLWLEERQDSVLCKDTEIHGTEPMPLVTHDRSLKADFTTC